MTCIKPHCLCCLGQTIQGKNRKKRKVPWARIKRCMSTNYLFFCFAGAVIHTVGPSAWHADYNFVDTVDQPTSGFNCQAAFELSAGAASSVRKGSCTGFEQLFFGLYGSGDPLDVSSCWAAILRSCCQPGCSLEQGVHAAYLGAVTQQPHGRLLCLLGFTSTRQELTRSQ